jgi:hypothetical protein
MGKHLWKSLQHHFDEDAVGIVCWHNVLNAEEKHKVGVEADYDEDNVKADCCKKHHWEANNRTCEGFPLQLLGCCWVGMLHTSAMIMDASRPRSLQRNKYEMNRPTIVQLSCRTKC